MAKVKDYFSHDYHARTDLRGIQKDFGLEGVGFYWCLVEILHENGGTIKASELEGIAYELHVSAELCTKVVNDYGKFTVKGGKISCARVIRNLKKRKEISEARRQAANERWSASKGVDLPEDEIPDKIGNGGFLDDFAKQKHTEHVDLHREWFLKRLEHFESGADVADHIWQVRGYIENIIDAVSPYPEVKIAHQNIPTLKFLETIQFYLFSKRQLKKCADIVKEVNEKAEKGKIHNKMNYLISALYQAVKSNGG